MIFDVNGYYDAWLNQLTPTERRCWLAYVNKVEQPRLISPDLVRNAEEVARIRLNHLIDGFRKEYTQYKQKKVQE